MSLSSRAVTDSILLFVLWAGVLPAQRLPRAAQAVRASIRTGTEMAQPISGGVFKEIDDSCTGDHWLLVRDADHPAGPGRLMRITRAGRMVPPNGSDETAPEIRERAVVPVIHTGDALVLEESTPLVEARLEARAMGPAVCGAEFDARLAIGGKVVRAVALGKGRAAFASHAEMRP
jgi:hypothetical protein